MIYVNQSAKNVLQLVFMILITTLIMEENQHYHWLQPWSEPEWFDDCSLRTKLQFSTPFLKQLTTKTKAPMQPIKQTQKDYNQTHEENHHYHYHCHSHLDLNPNGLIIVQSGQSYRSKQTEERLWSNSVQQINGLHLRHRRDQRHNVYKNRQMSANPNMLSFFLHCKMN